LRTVVGGKKVVRLVEKVKVKGPSGEEEVRAKIDTGADRTTVDRRLAERLGLGPAVSRVSVKASSEGKVVERPLVNAVICIAGSEFELRVGVADRSLMKYPAIVGRDILRSGHFFIDPSRKKKVQQA
jgi:hypothetical protein